MKTKIKNFILLLTAMSFFMVSCNNDDDDKIVNITLSASNLEIEAGESETVTILTGNNNYMVTSDDITVATVTYEKEATEFTVTGVSAGTTHISIVDGAGKSETLEVKVTGTIGTALGSAQNFTLVYTGSSQSDGKNINATVGVRWAANTGISTSDFRTTSTDGTFVMLTSDEFNAIETVEELEAAYAAGTTVTQYTVKQDSDFEQIYFISKVGDNYFKVHQQNLSTAGAGTGVGSTSDFSYQQ